MVEAHHDNCNREQDPVAITILGSTVMVKSVIGMEPYNSAGSLCMV